MVIETWYSQDVKRPVQVHYIDGNVFSQDNQGNKIGVVLMDGDTPVTVSGTISGSVIRADGGTVAVTGEASGNQAWVLLPQSAYAVPGMISIIIKSTDSSVVTTLCAVVGNVYLSSTDTVIDPGTIIPSIATLISSIETAIASIPSDYSSLWTSLAPAFNSGTKYNTGDYVTYDGKVWRFNNPHSGTWDGLACQQVSLGGDIGSLEIGAIPYIVEKTRNLFNWRLKFASIPGVVYDPSEDAFVGTNSAFWAGGVSGSTPGYAKLFLFPEHKKYTVSATAKISSATAASGNAFAIGANSTIRMNWAVAVTEFTRKSLVVDNTSGSYDGVQCFIPSGGTAGTIIHIKDVQIEEGETATEYTPPFVSTSQATLYPTGNNTDRSAEILASLAQYGTCTLTKGDYYVNPFTMPDGSTLTGIGEQTKVYPLNSSSPMVILGDKCTVSGISFLGATSDITPTANFYGSPTAQSPSGNVWEEGNQNVSDSGYSHIVLTTPIPAGFYQVSAYVVTSQTASAYSVISFSTAQDGSIGSGNIVASAQLNRQDTSDKENIYIPETVYSVRLTSGGSVTSSAGYTATFSQITVAPFDAQSALLWCGENVSRGIVKDCWFSRFSCAGIILMSTGTPVDRPLTISNCCFWNSGCGILIDQNSEFNKIVNCTVTRNYYGMINRGGNNNISNCGFDGNTVGIDINGDYGGNQGHGSIANCTLNHSDNNTGYGLIIRDTGRMLVTNCNFYYSKIKFINGSGNVISNCGFGQSAGLDVEGGSCSMLIGCMMRTANDFPISITNNNKIKFIECWTRDGVAITI